MGYGCEVSNERPVAEYLERVRTNRNEFATHGDVQDLGPRPKDTTLRTQYR